MDLARRIVIVEVGAPSSSARVASAAIRICEKLTECLAGMVGQSGVRTLLARSLTLSRQMFPWLPSLDTSAEGERWAPLHDCLVERDAGLAFEACTTLLGTFIALLGRLIGDAMVARLLHDIWPNVGGLKERT